ncbi:hypothetical protein C6T59_03215 [Burkholderia multivorans]|nr:hypothetical protein C6Q01_17920 [Burkholderia multivorans]PRF92033.1 hypothetical protein C6Q23_08455 [Burkholderia multivorans]PRG70501.1 hypothetical protein C6T59_03215 [Burkholderia multivorans]
MSAFRPDAPAAARAPLICNWRSYATVCGVAPPAALISAFEKLVHMNSMFNMLFFLLFHAIHSAEPAAGTRARASVPVQGRFARSERARRNGNRCRALNYRRLSESCVVTGAKGNRHPRHVERHIRKRRVLRVRNFFASVNNDATTQVISRPIIDCGGCHGVRKVCRALFPSAVEAGNDKAELATAGNAMS